MNTSSRRSGVGLTLGGALILAVVLASCQDRELPTTPTIEAPAYARAPAGPVVNSLLDDGDGTCTRTKCTLRDAINVAAPGETITFGRNVEGTIVLGGELAVTKDLTISGPGAAVLSVSGNGASRVLHIPNISTSATVALSGLTLTNGSSGSRGGAIYINSGADLSLTDVVVSSSSAGIDGGGIHNNGGSLTLSNTTVDGNTAVRYGGGISSSNGSVTLTTSTVSGNTTSADFGGGAGIAIDFGTLALVHSAVTGNASVGTTVRGGGIAISNSAAQLLNTIVSNNVLSGSGPGVTGGGIYTGSGALVLDTVTVSGNTVGANGSGGGIYNYYSNLTVRRSTVSGNATGASGAGGGISSYTSLGSTMAVVENSTISGNVASRGGGIENFSGLTRLVATTVTDNEAADGGGVWSWNNLYTRTDVKGSIIWGNTDGSSADDVAGGGTGTRYNSFGYNLVGAAGAYVDFIVDFKATNDQTGVTEAHLGSLAVNDPGTTATHALLAGSPAIDAGSCTDIDGSTIASDQRGVVRPQGTACDKGAYERESGTLFSASCTYQVSEKNGHPAVTVSWQNADPGVTLVQLEGDYRLTTKQMAPTATGSWSTSLRSGTPTWGLWGGADRKDASTVLVPAGTACEQLAY